MVSILIQQHCQLRVNGESERRIDKIWRKNNKKKVSLHQSMYQHIGMENYSPILMVKKEERLAILVARIRDREEGKLLGVPIIERGTGEIIAQAT